ncbi:hypothetical protein BDV29DRAFT_178278 [Aspergillus leporis]|uniref:Uncharacterized protein n=1 Tax=Aspergillus leporis TaxID=41062 RepID=A0A5N5WTS6_9EURO|nr:hypothetical protein BDV29DRAFT_178278 [Aspergillus leporis]
MSKLLPCFRRRLLHLNTGDRPLAEICLHDLASRGPLGCFLLIFNLRSSHYACIGALITVFAIGAGLFAQQMATVENNFVLSDEPAIVPNCLTGHCEFPFTELWQSFPLCVDISHTLPIEYFTYMCS